MFDSYNLSAGAIIEINCQGESAWHKLVYRSGKINKNKIEVCQKRHVRVAFNNNNYKFEWYNDTVTNHSGVIDNNTGMYAYELSPLGYVWHYERYKSFFMYFNLTTSWTECNDTYGWRDENTGLWNGILAEVSLSK